RARVPGRKVGCGSRPAIAPGPPYAGPFALLGQLVNELHYDLVVRLLLPIRVRRVVLEFDANDVVGNADEFRIVEEDGNDAAAYDARHENLSFERRPNLVGVVLVQAGDDVAALLAEYLLELSRPCLPQIVRFEINFSSRYSASFRFSPANERATSHW